MTCAFSVPSAAQGIKITSVCMVLLLLSLLPVRHMDQSSNKAYNIKNHSTLLTCLSVDNQWVATQLAKNCIQLHTSACHV